VFGALATAGVTMPSAEEPREPAVPVRASVKSDAITCLECGARFKTLKRHLNTDHGQSPAGYRARWNLAAEYPMVAPDYAARRREIAVTLGLGRKAGTGRSRKVVAA
jgi:predicted transcriptional regulator